VSGATLRRRHNVEWMVCNNCGAHLCPPKDVSDVGVEDYVESFEVPLEEPERLPTDEELAEINKARRERGLPELSSLDEWASEYRKWASEFRESARATARRRFEELQGRLKELAVVEEAREIKVVGKRWEALYEEVEGGWRLRCPRCGAVVLEYRSPT